jgi:hypothetical protein
VSEGEREIFRILKMQFGISGFREQATPLGKRFRYDFLVGTTFIEYDGLYHYRPGYAAPYTAAALGRFALQVMSDYKKTVYCRKRNLPLLRITGTLPADADFLSVLATTTPLPTDYSDYVAGHTLSSNLACHFRALATAHPRVSEPCDVEAQAGELVASVTILASALPFDEAMDCYQIKIAAFLIFLRENEALLPQEAVAAYGTEVMDACAIIAGGMPEFNGGVLLAPVVAAAVAVRGTCLVRIRDPFIVCWICQIQWTNNARSADLLLRHVNDVHAGGFCVRCATCPSTFCSFDEKTRAGEVGDVLTSRRREEQHSTACTRRSESLDHASKTSRCGHCDSTEIFSTRFRLFRHFNDTHGANFPYWCTLTCPTCGLRNFKSLTNLEKHVCRK